MKNHPVARKAVTLVCILVVSSVLLAFVPTRVAAQQPQQQFNEYEA